MKIEDHEIFKTLANRINNGDYEVAHKIYDWQEFIQVNFKFGFRKYFRFEIKGIRYMNESQIKLGGMDAYLKHGFLIPRQYIDPKEAPRDITLAIRQIMIARINNDAQVRADTHNARITSQMSKL